jgi:hypothetical protein
MIIDQDAVRSLERAKQQRPPEVDAPEMIMGEDASPRVDTERGAEAPSRSFLRRQRAARQGITSYEYDEETGQNVDTYA